MKVGCISNNDQCLPLLQTLKQMGQDVVLYIGASHVNDGKREQVYHLCKTMNISVQKEGTTNVNLYSWFESTKPDVVFVLGHISKIKLDQLQPAPPIYNIHFGKLPGYRGASPVFWQLKNNEPFLGCCIHELTDKIDAGGIVWEKEIPSEEHFNWSYVHFLFSNIVPEGVRLIVSEYIAGRALSASPQDESAVRSYHQPVLKDVLINWQAMTAYDICSLVKACNHWNNGAITLFNGMEVKIRDVSAGSELVEESVLPGTIINSDSAVMVGCANNSSLFIHYLAINDLVFPGRFADKYGFVKGQQFSYPSD